MSQKNYKKNLNHILKWIKKIRKFDDTIFEKYKF